MILKLLLGLAAVLLAFDLAVKYQRFIVGLQGRAAALTYASHGGGFIALTALAFHANLHRQLPEPFDILVPLGVATIGIYWLITEAVSVWLCTTGFIKLIIVLVGHHATFNDELIERQQAHGDASFVDPQDL
jgi:drug/metabolite transporter superfamily protein YnfA